MLEPIQLPSGKIVDLSQCIAIIPKSSSTDSEMILLGTQQQIQIDSVDLETLQQEIKQRQTLSRDRFNGERKTLPAQKNFHGDLTLKLQDFNNLWQQIAADENAKQESDALQQILDAERPRGQKLYSAEWLS